MLSMTESEHAPFRPVQFAVVSALQTFVSWGISSKIFRVSVCAEQVEVLLPEFWDPDAGPTFAEEGDQLRFWKLTRRFVEGIAQRSSLQQVKAVRCLPCCQWG